MATKKTIQEAYRTSYLSGTNAAYVQGLYKDFLEDPASVDTSWQEYFSDLASEKELIQRHQAAQRAMRFSLKHPQGRQADVESVSGSIERLVDAYYRYGHYCADLDPLGLMRQPQDMASLLDPTAFGFAAQDMQTSYRIPGLSEVPLPLDQLIQRLKSVFCGSIGFDFSHIDDPKKRDWLYQRALTYQSQVLSPDRKRFIMEKLNAAEGMEQFLNVQYVGQKRFSLEGCEALIVGLEGMLHAAAGHQVKEVTLGMAHRGRLSVMMNVNGMSAAELVDMFSGNVDFGNKSGDVKYHLGYSSRRQINGNQVKIQLAFNPSHLEAVSAVIMGAARSRQDKEPGAKASVLPVSIHGDAAVMGQGVVAETINKSQVKAHHVGGMVRWIVNNQIGFTASSAQTRSSRYCSDVFKGFGCPVMHVNADDPEAVWFCAQLATDYRQAFAGDVVIDLVGYRRMGHNEADEPSGTSPTFYNTIKSHPSVAKIYRQQLVAQGVVTQEQIDSSITDLKQTLKDGSAVQDTVERHALGALPQKHHKWHAYVDGRWDMPAITAVKQERLLQLDQAMYAAYQSVQSVQKQVQGVYKARHEMVAGRQPINWGCAEILAYATLLQEGYSLRLVGQDSERGTFSHRQAVLHDMETGKKTMPLAAIANEKGAGRVAIYNSVLTEQAVVGFEYGYAISDPETLVIWEAQFGDFVNGAQIIIDQFISSGWQKWQKLCGLVMLLPHGYEGMGPEHSSARLERFLQLAAQYNIQVCNPSTPAQIFHLLRRQMLRDFRKPLIVMTPKNLLRNRAAVSQIADLTSSEFKCVFDDPSITKAASVKRVVLCSGHVYYGLLARRDEAGVKDCALIRLEQLYPFPQVEMAKVLAQYKSAKNVVWCQEEPGNQGAWLMRKHCIEASLAPHHYLSFVGRPVAAAPACGYSKLHQSQQSLLIDQALGLVENSKKEAIV